MSKIFKNMLPYWKGLIIVVALLVVQAWCDLYNVSVLPRCFLIDEDHKILMKTENGIEIKQTLENLFED